MSTDSSSNSSQTVNPCLACGACCAFYRVSFYWAEIKERSIPDKLIEQLTPHHACLAGTNNPSPRCIALEGEVGKCVSCTAYEQRPSPCQELQIGDDKCNKARQKYGLPPILNEKS